MQRAKSGWAQRVFERGKGAYRTFSAHRATTLAGTLVFFLIMSLVPFLFWLTLLFGDLGAFDRVLALELFGWARDLFGLLRDNAQGAAAGASFVLVLTTLWSSSAFFYHLRRSGEIVYGEGRTRKGWKVRLLAIGMTFLVLLLIALMGAALVLVALVTRALPAWAGYLSMYAALLLAGFLAAWLLNIYVCPQAHRAKELLLGSFLTAVAWLVASAAFSLYLSLNNSEALYGALALIIVFLLWLYWLMICFMAGVIFNKHRILDRPPAPVLQ